MQIEARDPRPSLDLDLNLARPLADTVYFSKMLKAEDIVTPIEEDKATRSCFLCFPDWRPVPSDPLRIL
jgi:hypothetical protein